MAHGLSSDVPTVSTSSTFSWGKPGPGARIIARLASDTTKSVIPGDPDHSLLYLKLTNAASCGKTTANPIERALGRLI
jgi:hypothetical protein